MDITSKPQAQPERRDADGVSSTLFYEAGGQFFELTIDCAGVIDCVAERTVDEQTDRPRAADEVC